MNIRRFTLLLAIGIFGLGTVEASVNVVSESLELSFDDSGNLLRARACLPDCKKAVSREVIMGESLPLISLTAVSEQKYLLEQTQRPEVTELLFRSSIGDGFRRWKIPSSGYRIELQSNAVTQLIVNSGNGFQPPPSAGFGIWLEQMRYQVFDGNKVRVMGLEEPIDGIALDDWAGFRNRFWTFMLKPENTMEMELTTGENLLNPAMSLAPTLKGTSAISIYLGPVEPGTLGLADPALEHMMYAGLWFWLRWICMGLFWLLGFIHGLIPVWAISVMLLSLVVSIAMLPLNRIADRLQDNVYQTEALIGPQLRKIQSDYKGAEQSERILALYKEQGVHPLYSLKSMAGVAVLIPVFIGAFNMLAENIWLEGQTFMWITDLARPDAIAALGFSLPFFGGELNLLPFIMTTLSVSASILHRHEGMDQAQILKHKRNLTFMAVAFLALFYTFPAGMVLYWTTTNLVSVFKYGWQRWRHVHSGVSAS